MPLEIKGEILEGYFHKRLNRFIAEILVNDKLELAHVPNTGRLKELLLPMARIVIREVDSEVRKTKFDLLMVYHKETLVAIDSRLPNYLLFNEFTDRNINFMIDYEEVRKEVVYGASRLDIGLIGKNGNTLIEAKCVTLVEDGIAKFPDAPTDRGYKHVEELIKAKKDGFRTCIFFIIQRNDAKIFRPHWEMDKKFSDALKRASENDVIIKAFTCDVKIKSISIKEEIKVEI